MLVAFDFDGSLAESDPFVRLAEHRGMGDEVARLGDGPTGDTEEFEDYLRTEVERLEGMPVEAVDRALATLPVRPGASGVLERLHAADHHVAVVTDSFERAVEQCLDPVEFEADTVVANRLEAENGALTGDVAGPLLGRTKDAALKELAVEEGVPLENTLAVGDDLRDLPMLQAAEIAVGFDPVGTVEPHCDVVVNSMDRLRLDLAERGII